MRLTTAWADRVLGRLDDRLSPGASWPVALALSGGGDSIALLRLAAGWARRHGRTILALTVDHGLNPDSRRWSDLARDAATRLGADWLGLDWTGPKPSTGLPAAARAARHALLADAARAAGARVILMGHTASDIAEADWMRQAGAPLGRLRDWAPSPAWPEGRGLMLLRPLLDIDRQTLRSFLTAQNADWIEDPANADLRFHRSRARAAAPSSPPATTPEPLAPLDLVADPGSGVITGPLDSPWLGQAVACASGRQSLPAADRIAALKERLRSGGRASLSGALVTAKDGQATVVREPGRSPPPRLSIAANRDVTWDGRFVFRASSPGWHVAAAAGCRAGLSDADRAALTHQPAVARAAHPVLFREDQPRPLLAGEDVEAHCLVPDRLRLACGGVRCEDDLESPPWRGPLRRPI